MSETVEIQIGGKPYTFVLNKERRIDGIRVRVVRAWGEYRFYIETRDFYGSRDHALAQEAWNAILRDFRRTAEDARTSARGQEARAKKHAAVDLADLKKRAANVRANLKKKIAQARRELPRVEARAARDLAAFGGGK